MREKKVTWRCTINNAHFKCDGTVHQDLLTNTFSRKTNCGCPTRPGIESQRKIIKLSKSDAKVRRNDSIPQICRSALGDAVASVSTSDLPNLKNMIRAVGRSRVGSRPTNPSKDDKTFKIAEDFLPVDFLRKVVEVPSLNGILERHLIFISALMLYHLLHCKKWFLDGTFKIVADPFQQLFTISGFITCGGIFYI